MRRMMPRPRRDQDVKSLETETRPRLWSVETETRPRRQCHQSETRLRRSKQRLETFGQGVQAVTSHTTSTV